MNSDKCLNTWNSKWSPIKFLLENIQQYIEALIFASEQALSAAEVANALSAFFEVEISGPEIETEIDLIRIKYQSDEFFFELIRLDGGYQFLTKKDFSGAVSVLMRQKNKKKLSLV